ncbi:Crp/Fnr family transcriptional regulator [Acidocella sp.]|uniref:Crp/Fnr family transcriptional regulator n=1 Tax=Acidocella sp. TaxID=50710 RepID=UPI002634B219|nr:Crp/Fnr family transcriptional regulator [Acidocella sp.]
MVPISHTRNFFSGLPSEFCAALDDISTEHRAPAGQALLRAGGQCSQLYQLRAGTLECRMADGRGGETVTATVTSGEWLGLAEVFSGLPAAADVIAVTPVLFRTIAGRDFEALVGRHPLLTARLLRLFSLSVSAIHQQARDHNALPLKERLLRTLYMLAFSHGKTLRQHQGILIEMPQEELSRRLAAARQTLNRQLKVLEQEGLIRVNYGSITVLGLHRLAERQLNPARKTLGVAPDVS